MPISVPLTVDVTTGDVITPREIKYTFQLLFDDRKINILAYNLETILAEKIETVLSRSIANTRPRDFYDIFILFSLRKENLDIKLLKKALDKTCAKRGSTIVLENYADIIEEIRDSEELLRFWKNYQRNYDFAKGISFDEICDTILNVMNEVAK